MSDCAPELVISGATPTAVRRCSPNERWLRVVLIVMMSVTVGGIFYSTLGIDTGLQRLVAWGLGLAVGVFAYVAVGLLERKYLPSHRRPERPASPVWALFTGSPGPWQVPQLGIAVYLGLLLSAVARNGLFDVLYVRVVSVVFMAAVAMALSVGLYQYRQPSPRNAPAERGCAVPERSPL